MQCLLAKDQSILKPTDKELLRFLVGKFYTIFLLDYENFADFILEENTEVESEFKENLTEISPEFKILTAREKTCCSKLLDIWLESDNETRLKQEVQNLQDADFQIYQKSLPGMISTLCKICQQ